MTKIGVIYGLLLGHLLSTVGSISASLALLLCMGIIGYYTDRESFDGPRLALLAAMKKLLYIVTLHTDGVDGLRRKTATVLHPILRIWIHLLSGGGLFDSFIEENRALDSSLMTGSKSASRSDRASSVGDFHPSPRVNESASGSDEVHLIEDSHLSCRARGIADERRMAL